MQAEAKNAGNAALHVILYEQEGVDMQAIAKRSLEQSITEVAKAKEQSNQGDGKNPGDVTDPRLSAGEDALVSAQAKAEEGAYRDTYVLAQRAGELAHQASILIWADRRLHLNTVAP